MRGSRGSAAGIVEAARSNSSRVLTTGNAAVLSRVRALEASRAVISASTRVRSSSPGVHRWVFAVPQQSGASWRIAASLSRRSPRRGRPPAPAGPRSRRLPTAAAAGDAGRRWRSRTGVGSGPGAARARGRPRPGWAAVFQHRRRGWSARRRPASGRTRPPGPARRERLARRGRRPGCSARPAPARVGCSGRGGAGEERLRDRPSAQNAFSAAVFGRTARRGAGRGPP